MLSWSERLNQKRGVAQGLMNAGVETVAAALLTADDVRLQLAEKERHIIELEDVLRSNQSWMYSIINPSGLPQSWHDGQRLLGIE